MMLSGSFRIDPSDDQKWLRGKRVLKSSGEVVVHSVDLFSGCGGLSLGLREICRRMGFGHEVKFASEWDPEVMDIFIQNFKPTNFSCDDIDSLLSVSKNGIIRKKEEVFLAENRGIVEPEILLGGPPCQGHSDLNNHTRREDSRNNLYFRMVRASQLLNPKAIIIENVPTVIHSTENVVQRTKKMLEQQKYFVEEKILWSHHYGVPQKRKRHFLVASKISMPDFALIEPVAEKFVNKSRDLEWAIGDLRDSYDKARVFSSSATPSPRNQERMDYLLENDIYDLPNEERPPCHQQGHNYPAVYGRMRMDCPTDTITAGFGSTGQGRFMHPDAAPGRTLTPHEAARVQTFPDWFDFGERKRGVLSKSIGNAVPPLLAMYVCYVALSSIDFDLS